jgi:D-alanine transaminase
MSLHRTGRVSYVNGRYVPHAEATVHIEDRGYQFADAIYEACEVRDGAIIDLTRHLDRMERSLAALSIPNPMSRKALALVMAEVIRRNRVRHGSVYLQVSRGVARRDHMFPLTPVAPSVVVVARSADPAKGEATAQKGVGVITVPDIRWGRVDIKTTGLLPNVLAKEAARSAGAREAWFVDDEGFVTEGGSSNAWIVTRDGVLVTRGEGPDILSGITRRTILDTAAALGIPVEFRKFTVEEAKAAREAFNSSASTVVFPVVSIDGTPVANGHPGTLSLQLRQTFHDHAEARPLTRRVPA